MVNKNSFNTQPQSVKNRSRSLYNQGGDQYAESVYRTLVDKDLKVQKQYLPVMRELQIALHDIQEL